MLVITARPSFSWTLRQTAEGRRVINSPAAFEVIDPHCMIQIEGSPHPANLTSWNGLMKESGSDIIRDRNFFLCCYNNVLMTLPIV